MAFNNEFVVPEEGDNLIWTNSVYLLIIFVQ
jgi:hypothetical protein